MDAEQAERLIATNEKILEALEDLHLTVRGIAVDVENIGQLALERAE